MKKYFLRIFIIIVFVFSISAFKCAVYGKVCKGYGWALCDLVYTSSEELNDYSKIGIMEESILDIINGYGYADKNYKYKYNSYASYCEYLEQKGQNDNEENEDDDRTHPLTTPLVIWSKVTVDIESCSGTPGFYNVKIGDRRLDNINNIGITQPDTAPEVGKVSLGDIEGKLGGNSATILNSKNKEESWEIVIVTGPLIGEGFQTDGNGDKTYRIGVYEVLTGDDRNKNIETEILQIYDPSDDPQQGGESTANMTPASEAIAKIISILLDFVKTLLGDVPQMLANLIQTELKDKETGLSNLGIDFSPEDLISRGNSDEVTNPNAYIKFSEGKSEKADWQKEKTIPEGDPVDPIKLKAEDANEEQLRLERRYGFNANTQIPLISVDFYTLAANKVEFIDANFLDSTGNENKTWIFIRNFIASIVHAIMYLTVGIILLAIIWNGILMVKDSIYSSSAKEKQRHNEMFLKLGKAGIMLIGTLIFEAICIYGSGLFLEQIGKVGGDNLEGPIRVYVNIADYSFSTTPTGYVRYMADISNTNLNKTKAIYVGIYILLAWTNLILLLLMMIRMLMMMLMAVIGFAIIIIFIFENNGTAMYKYKSWAVIYAKFAIIQIVLGIAFTLLMKIAIN